MRQLLLLDADVIIDLHTLDLFTELAKSYELIATREVISEARYFKKDGQRFEIDISGKVNPTEDIEIDKLEMVTKEGKLARLAIDPGEASSIAYILQTDDILFCTCDKAAIALCAFMDIQNRAISLESAFRKTHKTMRLYPRHWEATFRKSIENGKTLRVLYKLL